MLSLQALKDRFQALWFAYLSWLNRYPVVGGAASFVLLAGILLSAHRWLLVTKAEVQTGRWEDKQAELRAERDQSYAQLLERQAEEANRGSVVTTQGEGEKLIGHKRVHLVFVKAPALSTSAPRELMDRLLTSNPQHKSSLHYLSQFIEKEAQKYDSKEFEIELVPHSLVYDLPQLERVGDVANPWGKDPFATSRLKDQFDTIIEREKLDVAEHDAVLFFYFDPSSGAAQDAVGSFYDHKTFRSFADETTKRAYINVYTLVPSFAEVLTEIATHEFLHLYGANDKYLETEYGCTTEGHGEIDKSPLFPQVTSDIMCGLIEFEEGQFRRGGFADDTLVINSVTAKEIGWESN